VLGLWSCPFPIEFCGTSADAVGEGLEPVWFGAAMVLTSVIPVGDILDAIGGAATVPEDATAFSQMSRVGRASRVTVPSSYILGC
jgi:hypothetical protein